MPRIDLKIDEYVQNKKWYWYSLPIFAALYAFFTTKDFELGERNPILPMLGHSINFVVHESAHVVTLFLPELFSIMAGSAAELFLGFGFLIGLLASRSYFSALVGAWWVVLSTQSVADYVADAQSQDLYLVSFGGGTPIHDWHYILDRFNLLEHDQLIAQVIRGIGIFVFFAMVVFCIWLLIRMYTYTPDPHIESGAEEAPTRPERISKTIYSQDPVDVYPTPKSNDDPPIDKEDPT